MRPTEDARPGAGRVLAAVRASARGATVTELASDLGLHVTTVRFHLERLERQGLVAGVTETTGRRGRPRGVYRAVAVADARAGMLAALADAAAGEGPAAVRAREAGERWAASLNLEVRDAASALTAVFRELGFAPEPFGDGLALTACPFIEEARQHPEAVCGVHQGLAAGIARRAGASVELRPFQGDTCVLAVSVTDTPAPRSRLDTQA